jgi:hypothetical protein
MNRAAPQRADAEQVADADRGASTRHARCRAAAASPRPRQAESIPTARCANLRCSPQRASPSSRPAAGSKVPVRAWRPLDPSQSALTRHAAQICMHRWDGLLPSQTCSPGQGDSRQGMRPGSTTKRVVERGPPRCTNRRRFFPVSRTYWPSESLSRTAVSRARTMSL